MSIIIRIPGSLSDWFDGKDETLCEGQTVGECFDDLGKRYPVFRDQVLPESDESSSVLVFVNGDNIRSMEGLATVVNDGDEISIIPLAAGG